MIRSAAAAKGQASSSRPLRILVVSSLYPPHVVGGAEVVAQRQAHSLRKRGHSVTVFAGRLPASDIPDGSLDVETDNGIKVYRVPLHSLDTGENFHIQHIATRLTSVLLAENPDIVHFHNVIGLGASLIPLASGMGYRTVVTLHDYWGFCYRATAMRNDGSECQAPNECALACQPAIKLSGSAMYIPMRLRRDYVAWCLESADLLICPSEALFQAYQRADIGSPGQYVVQSNGIDLSAIRVGKAKASEQIRFTCIAYLGEHKGIPDLLAAATKLADDKTIAEKWSITLIGDGHLRGMVEEAAHSDRLAGKVRYLGRMPREQVLEVLEETDVVILPSRWPENEPVSLLEAIAAGRAQIATDLGGMRALVDVGKSGELAVPGDPSSLAEVMASYVRKPDKAERHGAYNLRRRDDFAEDAVVFALEALYRQTLAKTREPPVSALILCGAGWPVVQIAEACHSLHKVQHPEKRLRLVWHGWLDNHAKRQAKLFWNWESQSDPVVIRHVLRLGIPVLGPEHSAYSSAIARYFNAAFTYDTYLEAAIALSVLPFDADALRHLRRNTSKAADFLAQKARQESFHLSLALT
jgi:glycosyltransferase involved in cell wall biosynthesis